MASDRGTLDVHCDEVRELAYPTSAPFTGTSTLGEKAHQKVFDGTMEQAGDLCAAGLQALAANPSVKWLALRAMREALNRQRSVAFWLEDTADRIYAVFNSTSANYAGQAHEQLLEYVHFGTGPMYVGDRHGNLPLFSTRPLRECYLGESAEGRVDKVFRRFKFTARQAVQEWGRAAGEKVLEAWADPKKIDSEFTFIHAVYPRGEGQIKMLAGAKGMMRPQEMPFADCVVNLDEKLIVAEGGFHEFPFAVPRMSKRAGEPYGRGCGMKALPDGKMLQRGTKVNIGGAELVMKPPLQVPDDGVVGPLSMKPLAMNHVRAEIMQQMGGNAIRPILTGANPQIGEELLKGMRDRIDRAYFVHLLQFARDPQMTATQVLRITEQTMQALNPTIARLQVEDLGAKVQRVFGIMQRGNMLLPVPPELEGQEIQVEYVSPIAKQQRVGEARGMAEFFELMLPRFPADHPFWDNFDEDEYGRDSATMMGGRRTWIRAPEDVAARRAQRAQGQADMLKHQQGVDTAGAVADVARALPAVKQVMQPQAEAA